MTDHPIPPKPRRLPAAIVQQTENSCTSYIRYIDREGEHWTPGIVEERLRKAVALQAALVLERRVDAIIAGREPESIGNIGGIGSIGGDGDDGLVAHAAEALSWLRWLEPDDAALVCARLAGAPWKSICWRFRTSRPTADRRYRYGLALIAWHLNGPGSTEPTPSLRALLGMRRAA